MSLVGNPVVYTENDGVEHAATVIKDVGANIVDLVVEYDGIIEHRLLKTEVPRDDTGVTHNTWKPATLKY